MKKILMFAAAATVALSSCQKNEILENEVPQANDGKIKFSSIQNLTTKAAPGHAMESTDDLRKLGNFKVVGYGTAAPIENVAYVTASPQYNGSTWEYTNEPYWPQQALNFMAYAPIGVSNTAGVTGTDVAATIAATGITKDGFTVGTANNSQIDFVVAKELGKTKENRTMLKFKHALTQVNFKAMVVNQIGGVAVPADDQLQVSISGVSINNIQSKGNFAWTAATTGTNNTIQQKAWGTLTDGIGYSADPSTPFTTLGTGTAGTVANATTIKQTGDNLSLLMIPQDFNAWDPQVKISDNDANAKGAYVKLMAKIWVTRGGNNVVLHGKFNGVAGEESDLSKYTEMPIYIPVSSLGTDVNDVTNAPLGQWVPGRKINYIITFGDRTSGSGGGGWTDNGEDVDPKPVLIPIRFTVALEDWVEQDVPLLTADVTGNTSSPLTTSFIKGYSDQVLNDIKGAQYPKSFQAKVNVNSTNTDALTANVNVSVADFLSVANRQWFRPGSTITWSVKTADWSTFGLANTDFAASNGWAVVIDNTPANPNAKTVTLTKTAESSITWSSLFADIDQFTLAIQKNIEGLAAPAVCSYTVNAAKNAVTLAKDEYLETGYLNSVTVRDNASATSTVAYVFSNITFGSYKITMDIPSNWTYAASAGNVLSADGKQVIVTGAGTVTFTR